MYFRKIFLMLFGIALSSYPPSYATKLSEILDTTQPALLLHVGDCQITSKVLLDESPCSIFHSEPSSSSDCSCGSMMAILYLPPPRMPDDAAQLLLVRQESNHSASHSRLEYNFVDIPISGYETSEIGKSKICSSDFKPFPILENSNFTENKLSGILYDDVYGYFYVLLSENSKKIVSYVFTPKFGSKAIVDDDFRYKFEVHHNFTNTTWSSDSYSQMFYYHKRKDADSPIELYAIPFPEIIESLEEGRRGNLIGTNRKGDSVQISGNLTYVSISSEPGFSSFKSSARERCVSFARKVSKNTDQIFGLFGWQYCKLKYQSKEDRMLCLDRGYRSEKRTSMITWYQVLIILILVLTAIVVSVMACLFCIHYWRKRFGKIEEERQGELMRRSSESFDFTL